MSVGTVGYGCELCIRDGNLMVCTERCSTATPGYTETERAARLATETEWGTYYPDPYNPNEAQP